jgi:hypothetical protein
MTTVSSRGQSGYLLRVDWSIKPQLLEVATAASLFEFVVRSKETLGSRNADDLNGRGLGAMHRAMSSTGH